MSAVMPAPDAAAEGAAQSGAEKPETDDDILKEARERYQACATNESDNRNAAKDDLLFLSGGLNQWNTQDANLRTSQNRPCLTVNNLPTFLHQVTNEQRLNKLGGKVSPVDDDADPETAEVIQGMVRHIEYDSNASIATVTAVNSAAAIGFGWFRLVTEYESEKSFDQKIMFKRIRNPLAVHIDPLSQEPDGSDMKFCFIDSLESRKEFERQYPKANANSTNLIGQEVYKGWFTQDTVLVCEYYRIKETPGTLCLYTNGQATIAAWKGEPLEPGFVQVLDAAGMPKERKSVRCTVEWFKVTGADVLERTVIQCKWIPVFPVYGDEIDIEGRVIRSGIIRNAKDPFKMYNYWITCATEEVALRPKSPFIMAEGQDEGHPEWNTANQRAYSKLVYKPTTVDGLIVPPPARQPMADIPSGMLSMAMHAADNKKATTGLFDSSLGARGNATSGIQEREQQAQGDMANYHYADNLKITYKHTLRCIVDMIPHYYDAARAVRILGEDETSDVVKINQPIQKKNPQTQAIEEVMHDLTIGTYDVTVQAGPSYSTQRQEAAEFMTNAMQAAKDPGASAVLTYLAIKNRDVPGSEEAINMLKKLPPLNQIVEPEEGDDAGPMVQTPHGPLPVPAAEQLIGQMGQALQNADKALDQAELLEKENKKRELDIREREAATKQYAAETDRKKADAELLKATNESKASDVALQAVSVSAAREAVSLVEELASTEAMQAPVAEAGGAGMLPPSPQQAAVAAVPPPA